MFICVDNRVCHELAVFAPMDTRARANAPAKNKLLTDAVHLNCKQFPFPLKPSQGLVLL